MNIGLRLAREEDYEALTRFAARCPALEAYPLHPYRILLRYCAKTCILAETDDGRLAG